MNFDKNLQPDPFDGPKTTKMSKSLIIQAFWDFQDSAYSSDSVRENLILDLLESKRKDLDKQLAEHELLLRNSPIEALEQLASRKRLRR